MPNRLLTTSLVPQLVVNTLAAAMLLISVPAISPAAEDSPSSAVIALNESTTAADFAPQIPAVLTFTDRMGTAEFAQLPAPLVMDGAAYMSGYRAGDVAYLDSEQSIVIFLSGGGAVPDRDLVLIGHVTSGLDNFASCIRDCVIQLEAQAGAGFIGSP